MASASRASRVPHVLPPSCEYADLALSEEQGLYVYDDVIDEQTEAKLTAYVKSVESKDQIVRTRCTTHFGRVFNHKTLRADDDCDELPETITSVIDRILREQDSDPDWSYDQITINRYPKGQRCGIGFHVDTHSEFDDRIVVLSLGSPVEFQFTLPQGESDDHSAIISLWLKPRSLMIMSGESRYLYRHRVPVRVTDTDPDGKTVVRAERISITVRKTRDSDCDCDYPICCDSQNPSSLVLPTRLGN